MDMQKIFIFRIILCDNILFLAARNNFFLSYICFMLQKINFCDMKYFQKAENYFL